MTTTVVALKTNSMVLLVKQTLYNQLVTVTLHQDNSTNSSDIAAKQMNTFHITYVEVWTGEKKGVEKTQSLKKKRNQLSTPTC